MIKPLSDEDFIRIFTDEQKRQGVPDKYNIPEAIAGNVVYHRRLAQEAQRDTLRQVVEWVEKFRDDTNLIDDNGNPVVTYFFDQFAWEAFKKEK